MSSPWTKATVAWFGKEARTEFRSKSGLFNTGLFGFMAVVTAVFATFDQRFPPVLSAAFLCVVLVFSAVVTVPRVFLVEEDHKTFELARLIAEPSVIYTGKAIFCALVNGLGGLVFASVFAGMTQSSIARWDVLALGSVLFAVALAQCLSLCSALVMGAENRYVLAGVVALPLLLPLVFCGVGVLKFAFGEGPWGAALRNIVVLVGYGVGVAGIGPILSEAVWGKRRDPKGARSVSQNEGRK